MTATCGEKYAEKPVTVSKPIPAPAFVQICKKDDETEATPESVTIPSSGNVTLNYNAKVYDQYGAPMGSETVDWSISGATTGVTQSLGTVTVAPSASEGTVTLTAASHADGTKKDEVSITLSRKPAHNIGTFEASNMDVIYCRSAAGQTVSSNTGTVKYSSSDPSIVEVNANTGLLTIHKVTPSGSPVTITATVEENGTHAAASKSYTVTVKPKELEITGLTAVTRTYEPGNINVDLIDGTMPGVVSGDEVFVTIPTTGTIENANAGNDKPVTVTTPTLTGANAGNYTLKPITGITVTIDKAKPTGEPTYTAINTSGKTLADANLTIGTITPAEGTLKWVNADNTELAPETEVKANTSYKWLFTPNDPNYDTLTGSIKLWHKSSSSGGGGGGSSASTYTITVEKTRNGDISVSPRSAEKGDTVTVTVDPDKGYTLETLTVLDQKGKEIKLTAKNGKYTFKMPASRVTVKGTFMEDNTMLNFFVDVPTDAYYYDAVLWAAENGITGGVDTVHFAPNAVCTRAQIVTFLWRAAGSPEPKTMSTFSDVPADAYYAKAVAWAVENEITGGIGGNRFAPNATCTRAQSVTFLYRAAGSPAVSGGAEFSDVGTDAYYANAVAWAAENGITGGIGGGLFGSNNDCTRAQIVTFLYRSVK